MKWWAAIAAVLVFGSAWAEKVLVPVERWACTPGVDRYNGEKDNLWLTASGSRGQVLFGGVTEIAYYELAGLERKWHWGLRDGSYDYTLNLRPDDIAFYFDFSSKESTKSSATFKCAKVQ